MSTEYVAQHLVEVGHKPDLDVRVSSHLVEVGHRPNLEIRVSHHLVEVAFLYEGRTLGPAVAHI